MAEWVLRIAIWLAAEKNFTRLVLLSEHGSLHVDGCVVEGELSARRGLSLLRGVLLSVLRLLLESGRLRIESLGGDEFGRERGRQCEFGMRRLE